MFYLQNSAALEGQKLLEDIFDQDASQGCISMRMFQPYLKTGSRALVINDQSGGLALLAKTMGCSVQSFSKFENQTTDLLKKYGYEGEIYFHSENIEDVLKFQKFDLILIKNGVLEAKNVEFSPKLNSILGALDKNGTLLLMQDLRPLYSLNHNNYADRDFRISVNRFLLLLNVPNSKIVDVKFHGFISTTKGWRRLNRLRSLLDSNLFNKMLPKHFLRSASGVIQNNKDLA
ncbi:MAG: hypothetical protein GC193_04475 [Cryomorphaceae bacterium]|nr:hypothetical protein [Cryomorphaceae bacterium]